MSMTGLGREGVSRTGQGGSAAKPAWGDGNGSAFTMQGDEWLLAGSERKMLDRHRTPGRSPLDSIRAPIPRGATASLE
jgi:hypothetical protein